MSGRNGIRLLTVMVITVFFFALSCGGSTDPTVMWDRRKAGLLKEAEEKPVQELINSLESDDAGVRVASYMALIERGPEEVIPIMIRWDEATKNIRLEYWKPLCSAWGADAVPVLIENFNPEYLDLSNEESTTNNFFQAWNAVDGLIAIGPDASDAAPLIIEALREPVDAPVLNGDLCDALVSMEYSTDEAIDLLLGVLDADSVVFLPDSACYALGKLASPEDARVIERLQEYADEYENNPRLIFWNKVFSARAALYMLGVDKDENFEIIEIHAWPEELVDKADSEAWSALAQIGDERAIAVLSDIAMNSDDMSIILAYGDLASIGPKPEIIEGLTSILDRVETDLVKPFVVAYILGKLGEAARPALPEMIELHNRHTGWGFETEQPENLVFLEESIIRVHEGIAFPSFLQ